ncbi:MAG: hypothetical protein BGO51_18090 [Rhodospirillales bacterium 69-11]|nr:MAG: hypothetical protein ABS99_01985 [Acetobacteraceae bacterium SCN 69-10]OJW19290.1 MAG: hypothetical protein BGO51_18090 [Rhodospirillales bacterium 69-11]
MIDIWRLPGPIGIVRKIVSRLLSGNIVCLRSDPDWDGDLQRAITDALHEGYALMQRCYDDAARDPGEMLAELRCSGAALDSTVFWIDEIPADRAAAWNAAGNHLADGQRDLPPGKRLRIVIALPVQPTHGGPGLEVLPDPVLSLSRMDLEVMARYQLRGRSEPPVLLMILATLAVELTAPRVGVVGCRSAIEELSQWLRMPIDCLGDPRLVKAFAGPAGLVLPDDAALALLLWRSQQGVLIGEIDARRRALIAGTKGCWRIPYQYQRSDAAPVDTVHQLEFLQLGHLTQQARTAMIDQTARARLRLLKSARDDLSHLRFLSPMTIREVLKQPV